MEVRDMTTQVHNRYVNPQPGYYRSTRYEIVIDGPGGRKLAGYTMQKSRHGIVAFLRSQPERFFANWQGFYMERGGKSAADGWKITRKDGALVAHVRFSGRTEKDAAQGGLLEAY